jgi:4-hydroxy-2-oxoheptanedioate aldolase
LRSTSLSQAVAAGIVAPGVEAAALIDATRFAPEGTRGACPIVRAAAHSLLPWHEAIAAIDGLGGLMIGPFDLSVSLGLGGAVDHPAVTAAAERVFAAARSAGRSVWLPVFAAEPAVMSAQVERWAAKGVRHFVIGADKIIVAQALRAHRAAASAALPGSG